MNATRNRGFRYTASLIAAFALAACASGPAGETSERQAIALQIEAGNLTMKIGETIQIHAAVSVTGTRLYTVAYTSRDPKTSSVTGDGVITAVAAGSTTIDVVATLLDTGATATANVAVTVEGATGTTDGGVGALQPTVSNWIDFAFEGDIHVPYTGLVRYGRGNNWLTRTVGAEGVFDCNGYFNGIPGAGPVDPAPGFLKSCQKQVSAPNVVQTGGMPVINVPLIQPAYKGYSTQRVLGGGDTGNPNQDTGAFREPCTPSHFGFNDPIVFPGQPGKSHLHLFFGNTALDANTTAANITTAGDSTCAGGTLNRTGYWAPALIDLRNGAPLVPTEQLFYYKGGYLGVPMASIKPFPAGLRMIAGNAANKTEVTDDFSKVRIWCEGGDGTPRGRIPSCNKDEQLSFTVIFPQCWDGKNLDSADHKSHMAYANGGCPSTHPVALPEITVILHYTVTDSGTDKYLKLASDNYEGVGGFSMHADWFNGWDTNILNEFVTNCINPSKDCHAQLLGDGRYLY